MRFLHALPQFGILRRQRRHVETQTRVLAAQGMREHGQPFNFFSK